MNLSVMPMATGRIAEVRFGRVPLRYYQKNQTDPLPKERLVPPSLSRVILGSLDILVDIGFPAEKEVIQ